MGVRASSSPDSDMLPSTLLPLVLLPFASSSSPWTWTCDPDTTFCARELHIDGQPQQGEAKCRLTCAPTTLLWPHPNRAEIATGKNSVDSFTPKEIKTDIKAPNDQIKKMVDTALSWQVDHLSSQGTPHAPGHDFNLAITVTEETVIPGGEVKEEYTLTITTVEDQINAQIIAPTYFGARHGLETLFQLTVWDSFTSTFIVNVDVDIGDKPFFPHRGVMIDTSRNFISVTDLMKLIDSMSYSKLNVFHWHVTDSQSFPLFLPSLPEFSSYGAYNEDQVYTPEQVRAIVQYGRLRGIQVIPELDAPAHVGAGWEAVDSKLTVCVNREPWTDWCVEPPCGQLNPTIPELYDVLEKIYRDWLDMFEPTTFHMGQDEVHFGCWNSTPSIVAWLEDHGKGVQEEDFIFLWNHFLDKSYIAMANAASSLGQQIPRLTMWNNHLVLPDYISTLDKSKYAIQLWTDSTNLKEPTIKAVAEAGFKMIFSNYDATYLDCGFGGWVGNGNNWCTPYKQWQLQHQNDPLSILEKQNVSNLEEAKANVLGGEVAMWTEQADGLSMMTRIEPRASAYGERLWRGPLTGGWVEAERRLVVHRERLARRGVSADSLTHGWCRQNEGKCILEDGMESQIPLF